MCKVFMEINLKEANSCNPRNPLREDVEDHVNILFKLTKLVFRYICRTMTKKHDLMITSKLITTTNINMRRPGNLKLKVLLKKAYLSLLHSTIYLRRYESLMYDLLTKLRI